jgi:hypothetical protein
MTLLRPIIAATLLYDRGLTRSGTIVQESYRERMRVKEWKRVGGELKSEREWKRVEESEREWKRVKESRRVEESRSE